MYVDNAGNEFESYEAACVYYGADTPASLEAEEAYWAEQWLDHCSEHDYFPDDRDFAEIYPTTRDAIPF